MEGDSNVRRLVENLAEFLIYKKPIKEDLTCSLTSEFLRNMQDILFTKSHTTYYRWEAFYDSAHVIMMSSSEMYLKCVIYACLQDANLYYNVFEKFLNSFALITSTIIETCDIKLTDFSRVSADIFMVLYEQEYRKRFLKRGGFRRLVEHVNNPKYLDSNCVVRNISESYELFTSEPMYPQDVVNKFFAMTKKEPKILQRNFSLLEVETNRQTSNLVKKMTSTARPIFIPLCGKDEAPKKDSTQRTPTKIEKESNRIVKTAEKESFDSETVRQISDNTQYESIIEAVIRHNHAKSSGQVKSASRIQKEADGILKHLKIAIKSLIEVLDNDRE